MTWSLWIGGAVMILAILSLLSVCGVLSHMLQTEPSHPKGRAR